MSFFGLGKPSDRYGVIIDVGSGSVLAAIVHSDPTKKYPHIIWAKREHIPLKQIESLQDSAKATMTALMNVSMLLDSEGRKVMREYRKDAKITQLQCTISAPWSYTITKHVHYSQEENFEITDELIKELISAAEKQINEELQGNDLLKEAGLTTICHATMETLANGYRIASPEGEQTKELSLSHGVAVAQKYIINNLSDVRDKLFANLPMRHTSFIMALFQVGRETLPQTFDTCLIDITYEATEIGVVRDGVLKYSTHTSFGSFSIAREIAAITDVPLGEAFGYLHSEKPGEFLKLLTTSHRAEVEAMLEEYIERLHQLFMQTGDTLAIPKHITLHADLMSEPFFAQLIEKAAKRSTKSAPVITSITKKILTDNHTEEKEHKTHVLPTDTALLISAQFFHTEAEQKKFCFL